MIEELLSLPVQSNPSKMAPKKEELTVIQRGGHFEDVRGAAQHLFLYRGVIFFLKHMLFVAFKQWKTFS